MSADDDQLDVECVLAGDVAAFERIVRRWQRPLVNLAYRYCHDRSRAEDLAQEAFLRTYRGLRGWRRDGAFSTWLFALATNVYRTELRRLPPRAVPIAEALATERAESAPRGDAREDERRHRLLREAVSGLPAKYRDALTLFYFHEMDVGRAAMSLGVPEGTLKARLSRGRDLLRRKLRVRLGLTGKG